LKERNWRSATYNGNVTPQLHIQIPGTALIFKQSATLKNCYPALLQSIAELRLRIFKIELPHFCTSQPDSGHFSIFAYPKLDPVLSDADLNLATDPKLM
jgi:hypothetical protein